VCTGEIIPVTVAAPTRNTTAAAEIVTILTTERTRSNDAPFFQKSTGFEIPGVQLRQDVSPSASGFPHLPQNRATRSGLKRELSILGSVVPDGLPALHMRQFKTVSGF